MKEEYLHQIWQAKRLPMHALTLTDGRKLEVSHTGWLNKESGPDFFNGSILLDGIRWNGNIEIHIRSSDWYAHKHEFDEAYNNVILHVVYQHDKPVTVLGEELPTLELQHLLDRAHWASYEDLINASTRIPCAKHLPDLDEIYFQNQIETALVARLVRKSALLSRRFESLGKDLRQLQYETLALAFGTKINALPFVELTRRLPIQVLWRENKEATIPLLLGMAGFLDEISLNPYLLQLRRDWKFLSVKHNLQPMEKATWKFFGLRPAGFPPFRLVQFAGMLNYWHGNFSFLEKPVPELLKIFAVPDSLSMPARNYWQTHYHFAKAAKVHETGLSKGFQNLLLINAVAPLLWWWGNHRGDEKALQRALDLLSAVPAEHNAIIAGWKKLNMPCKSAHDSQGLLELKNEFCNNKKCLSCHIGHKVLSK
jgi:hypothetical protein